MEYGVWAIVAICVLVLIIGTLKQKSQIIFNFIVRVVLGCIGIYFCNQFLEMQKISAAVGVNPVSVLTVGTLGFSGFVLLYGIMLYKIL